MAGAGLLVVAATRRPAPLPARGLYLFFSQDSPGLSDAARAAREAGLPVRPVFLPTRFEGWSDAFLRAVADLGEFAVVDEEGLALARRLGLRRTPALVLVDDRGIHVATGHRSDPKELFECSRSR